MEDTNNLKKSKYIIDRLLIFQNLLFICIFLQFSFFKVCSIKVLKCVSISEWFNPNFSLIPFPHIDAFWRLCSRRLFENLVTKKEIAQIVQFLILAQCFPLFVIGYPFNYGDFPFFDKIRSKSSAHSRIAVWGKGLNRSILMHMQQTTFEKGMTKNCTYEIFHIFDKIFSRLSAADLLYVGKSQPFSTVIQRNLKQRAMKHLGKNMKILD